MDTPALHVICLCAAWCGTCRDYAAVMNTLRAEFPTLHFSWVDVEDQADMVDPVDINDFPTLLITRDQQPVFFGILRPQADALRRLIQTQLDDLPAPLTDAEALGLAQRLRDV
jgi:thiol-disulfide isomerase/thioredoxin